MRKDDDLERLWDTVQQDLPFLAKELDRVLPDLDSSSDPHDEKV